MIGTIAYILGTLILVSVLFGAGFVCGMYFMAQKMPASIANMDANQLKKLAERVAKER